MPILQVAKVLLLLKAGAAADIREKDGNTPLHLLCSGSRLEHGVEIASLLILHG